MNGHHGTLNGSSNLAQMPATLPEPKIIDSLVAKELNEMSVNEREIAYEDVHGVSQTIKETPEFVSKSLYEMHQEVNKIRDKPAYDLAYSQDPNYAGGRFMYLMFLRSARFNARMGALRLVKYFEHKRIYFGDKLLARRIRYADLNDDDIECLKCGWLQVLPFRDKSGRAVVWFIDSHRPKKGAISLMRANWYFTELCMMDEETQKAGVITVSNRGGLDLSKEMREFLWHISNSEHYSPARVMCSHFCLEDRMAVPLVSLVQLGFSSKARARTRIHCGTQTEWMYNLMSFGIPVDYAPVTSSGNLKTKYFRQWLAHKYFMETTTLVSSIKLSDKNIIDLPRRHDILLGKGSLQNKYSGNQIFLQIIQENSERYLATLLRKERTMICKDVWRLLREENVRFLERGINNSNLNANKNNNNNTSNTESCCWVELTDESTILSKIAYHLRTKKPKPQPPKNDDTLSAHHDETMNGSVLDVAAKKQSGCIVGCCASLEKDRVKRIKR